MHWVPLMASSSPVFPEITLVIDGRPRRIRSLIPLTAAELGVRRRKLRRAWPVYLAAIAIGIGVGLITKQHAHHDRLGAAVQTVLH